MPNNNAALNATIDSLTKLIEQGAELGAGTLHLSPGATRSGKIRFGYTHFHL
jgi:hypothetical protein